MSIPGFSALVATAMPDTRPPPPTGTTIVSTSGTASRISNPTVPCPAMILASSNAGTNVAPVSAADRDAVRERAGEVGAREHHLGLVHLGARDLRERRVGGHHDRRRDPEPVGVVGEALRVVAGRRGDDAAGPSRVGEPEQEVERAAFLERGRELEVLELRARPARR